jgi:tRNA(Ile)-lysidine synthase TilS/MesJ
MCNTEKASLLCSNCVLPGSFPGISFNREGLCNYCVDYKSREVEDNIKSEYRKRFEDLISRYKGKSTYDLLMCYSGGKDSTYTLSILKQKYGLNILALTFDNGFLSEFTPPNIRSVVEKLGVDHIYYKPNAQVLGKIFRHCIDSDVYSMKAIERASNICTSCIGILKYSALRLALEKGIPLIGFGWSPGQAPVTSSIIKNNPQMVRKMQATIYNPLHRIVGDAINPYFVDEKYFSSQSFPYYVHPLAFLDYDEKDILRNIASLGWTMPQDVDANSTNCLLNSFANVVHKNRYGFHPYSYEMANLVREGFIKRSEALERLNRQEDPRILRYIGEKLGYPNPIT